MRVAEILGQLGIPYMVVGSVASSHHGRPRATHDADIVIDPTSRTLDTLIESLEDSGLYVSRERARAALASRGQFNVIDVESASKIDLTVRKERSFSRKELERRYEAEISKGRRITLATAEDTILAKLEWAKKSGEFEKQLRDVVGSLDVRTDLDLDYIEAWTEELGVVELWRRVLRERP